MSAMDVSTLSYKELQAIAKSLGIPANIKKDAMINEINRFQTKVTETTPVEMSGPVAAEVPVEIDPAVVDGAANYICPIVEETSDHTQSHAEAAVLLDELQSIESNKTDKLVGFPSPKGTKTIFLSPDFATTPAPIINWRLNELTPMDENSPVPACQLQYQNDSATALDDKDVKLYGFPTPTGKKTTFLSPELKMGTDVHWRIEDYDVAQLEKKVSSLSVTKPLAWERTADPQVADDLKMKFWLSKGNTPLKAALTPNSAKLR